MGSCMGERDPGPDAEWLWQRASRVAFHTFVTRETRGLPRVCVWPLLDRPVMGSLHVARSTLPEHDVWLLVLHGWLGSGHRELDLDHYGLAPVPWTPGHDHNDALPRSW